ncbi:small ribosomal subunit protein mS23-like isoform X2 [Babylonia areolata]|uniref:small ribosomal subunit protein mS23-like isoform X2 n=1 Tax=Babylonia areolata TaxID=304850 RepID=UPI003FD04E52
MAGSRLEKFGTIYKRVQGLLRSGAMKPADRPMWCDVYEAFPPRDSPLYERPVPNRVVPQIMYPEDIIRVQFYKTYGNPDVVDLTKENVKTTCQRFVDKYIELLQTDGTREDLFEATTASLKEQGLRLRSVSEIQEGSVAKETRTAESSAAPAAKPRLSVASIFGQDTVARALAEDQDFEVDDSEDRDPKLF